MKKRIAALLIAVCLSFSGCASLLERSYSSVEPYTDRFWDSTAEDTLKAENYQDLVNSLLMLVEQRSDEVVIRYYGANAADSYAQALKAKREVQYETVLGAYLLNTISVIYSTGDGYCTLTYYMTYRDNVQDIASLMTLSDTQSLVDLLRVSVREGHGSLTAQFVSDISRAEVIEAVDELWEELYLAETTEAGLLLPPSGYAGKSVHPGGAAENAEPPTEDGTEENAAAEAPHDEASSETVPASPLGDDTSDTSTAVLITPPPFLPEIPVPPCPWDIHFYPDTENAKIVEIILK